MEDECNSSWSGRKVDGQLKEKKNMEEEDERVKFSFFFLSKRWKSEVQTKLMDAFVI